MDWGELSKAIQLRTIDGELTESHKKKKRLDTSTPFFFSLYDTN